MTTHEPSASVYVGVLSDIFAVVISRYEFLYDCRQVVGELQKVVADIHYSLRFRWALCHVNGPTVCYKTP